MSLKRVALMAALALLVMPAAAFADGITFGFTGGHMYAVQPASGSAIGTVATNDPNFNSSLATATLYYVSRFSGNVIPTSPLTSPLGPPVPPQITPTFGVLNNIPSNNFGSVQWTTGVATASSVGASSSSTTYNGGSLTVFGNGSLAGTGSTLFSGSFVGPVTFASIGAPKNPTCSTCNFWYSLTGQVSGQIDPGLLSLLNLNTSFQNGQGFFFSFIVGFVGPNDTIGNVEGGTLSVVQTVPEPGTLALFGTGLIGLAGFIRRRFKA